MAVEVKQKKGGCQKCFIIFLRVLKVLSILSLLLNITAYVLGIKSCTESRTLSNLDKSYQVLSSVGFIVFSLILILSEFEPRWFNRLFYVLHYWFGRGFGLVWSGVQTNNSMKQLVGNLKAETNVDSNTIDVIGQVCGWTLISVGLLYCVMAVLWIRDIAGLGKNESELEVRLIGSNEATVIAVESSVAHAPAAAAASAEDLLLLANIALAMGMTVDDARRRFSGKKGQQEAEKFLKSRATEAISSVQKKVESVVPATIVQAATTGAINDDDDTHKKKGEDDDELTRMYYAQHATENK